MRTLLSSGSRRGVTSTSRCWTPFPWRRPRVSRGSAARAAAVGREEAVPEAVHRPHGRAGSWPQAVLPAPRGDAVEHGWVAGDDADRHVVAGVVAGDDADGLVVPEHQDDEVVVVGGAEERHDAVERVRHGLAVCRPYPCWAPPHDVPGRRRLRLVEEERAVADAAPVDELGVWCPRGVARDQVDLGHERLATDGRSGLELEAVEGRERVLVGHGGVAEAGTGIAEGAGVVDLVVAVVGLPLGPVLVVGWDDVDRPPAGAVEGPRQGEAPGVR